MKPARALELLEIAMKREVEWMNEFLSCTSKNFDHFHQHLNTLIELKSEYTTEWKELFKEAEDETINRE